jgi:hypothetical protein
MQGVPSKRDEAAAKEKAARSGKDSAPRPGAGEGTPRHVAIIMDGNGRWATKRSLPRVAGHRAGMEAVRRAVRTADARGISYLTLFSFSTENWARPVEEVSELMGLLKFFIRSDLAALHRQNVRIRVIGARAGLAREISALLDEAEGLTKANTGGGGGWPPFGRRLDRGYAGRSPAERGYPRSGPVDPNLGRTTDFEFPALAMCLCGILFHAGSLAGIR